MPGKRVERMDEEKKERLLRAAIREFGAHGFELASMNRILDEAGLSKSSFYYFFHDKTDLAAAALLASARASETLLDLREPRTAREFWGELRRVSLANVASLQTRRDEYECVTRLSGLLSKDPAFAAKVMPHFEPNRRKMMEFLQRGVTLGAMRSDVPLPLLMALIESVKATAWRVLYADRPATGTELQSFADLTLDLAQRLTAPPKHTKSKTKGSNR
ncbi:MAG: TetR/AcrR family transcriptional regulator [Myxococcota bacterium]